MEFKGTTENWKQDGTLIFADDYFQTHICKMSDAYNVDVNLANALLISKAPEMLEMLERFLEITSSFNHPKIDHLRGSARQLIKEATTI
jgi:hypothetical protein